MFKRKNKRMYRWSSNPDASPRGRTKQIGDWNWQKLLKPKTNAQSHTKASMAASRQQH
jgi:hypothetical protein